MINKIYINGVQINNNNRYLAKIKDAGNASIDIDDYARGGRDGVALSKAFYRGFAIAMEWFLVASSASDLVSVRDNFIKLFKLNIDRNQDQTKRLGFELANGVTKEIPIIFTSIKSSLDPANVHTCIVTVTGMTELEYFYNSVESSQNVPIYKGGGMALPMAIPMNFATPLGQEQMTITNDGNAEYYPLVTVYGAMSGFDFRNSSINKTLSYSGSLSSSDFLELDFYNRTALFNGQTSALAQITGDWWWLNPGDNVLKLITTSGEGYALVKHRDAYRGI